MSTGVSGNGANATLASGSSGGSAGNGTPNMSTTKVTAAPEEGERLEGAKVTEVSNRTTYADNVGSTEVSWPGDADTMIMGRTDPYPSDAVTTLLTREYRLAAVSWPAAYGTGVQLTRIFFPDVMLSFPFIFDRLKNYLYFRSRLRISIRINTTKYEYGSVVVSWLPFYNPTTNGYNGACRHLTLTQSLQNNGMILSANIGNTLTFDIPWIVPRTYLTVADIATAGFEGIMGTMFINVLTPLLSVSPNPPSAVDISVFARFVDPEVAGLQPIIVPGMNFELNKKNVRAIAQMSDIDWRLDSEILAEEEAKSQAKRKGKGKGKGAASEQTFSQKREGVVKEAGKFMKSVMPAKKSKNLPKSGNQKEEEAKVAADTTVSTWETIVSVATTVGNVVMGVVNAAEKIGPLLGMVGLSKPMLTTPIQRVQQTFDNDVATMDGLFIGVPVTMNTDAHCGVDPNIIDGCDPGPDVYSMCRLPALWQQISFDKTNNPDDVLASWLVFPMNQNGIMTSVFASNTFVSYGPLQWYTNMFRRWRGSLKVLLLFNTSTFTTTRVRITHLPGVAVSAGTIANYSGDLVSKVVDITGDTSVEFNIPYLSDRLFLDVYQDWTGHQNCPTNATNGTLMLSLVNPVNASDTTAATTVYCTAFLAAGEDYQLQGFVGPRQQGSSGDVAWKVWNTSTAPSDPMPVKAIAQMHLASCFGKPFPGLIPGKYTIQRGLVTDDPPGSIIALGHRFVWAANLTTQANVMPSLQTGTIQAGSLGDNCLWWYVACHLFCRGSMRVKIINPNAMVCGGNYAPLDIDIAGIPDQFVDGVGNKATVPYSAGLGIGYADTRPLSIEIPYNGNVPFVEMSLTQHAAGITTDFSLVPAAGINSNSQTLISFGDDFSVGGICAPPLMWYVNAASTTPFKEKEKTVRSGMTVHQ